MEELYPNYLWRVPVTADMEGWDELWPRLEQQILEATKNAEPVNHLAPRTSALYHVYNIFAWQDPLIDQLKQAIKKTVSDLHPGQDYYIRGWLNVMREQNVLNWHDHITDIVGGMHGYLSITSEPSVTVYRIGEDLLNVKNRNGYAIIGYCNRDQHRTTPMPSDTPRVSAAFDIVPTTYKLSTADNWVLL